MRVTWHLMANTAVIRIEGNFTSEGLRDFKTAMSAALGHRGVNDFCVDMADVDYLDSSALGMLAQFHDRAGHRRITLTHCHGAVKMVLVIANYEKLFRIEHA